MDKKICIVVDHPIRDLNGYIYFISKFKNKNITFYLVPYYNFREIYIIRPDLVILNHSRWIYENFLSNLSKLNISTIVIDTEGGMINDQLIKEYYDYNELAKNNKIVDAYFIWSKSIKNRLLKNYKSLNKNKFLVGGNPRFNYIKKSTNYKLGKNLLVNFNFATINPRFSSFEKEKELLEKQKHTRQWIKNYSSHQIKMRKKFIFLIKQILNNKKINNIILRPHPYENLNYYKSIFSKYSSVKIRQDSQLKEEINKSFVILHNNCGTSVDANLMGRPCIFFQPFKSKYLDQKFLMNISVVEKDYNEIIKKILSFKRKKISFKKNFNKINNDFVELKNNISNIEKYINKKIYNKKKNQDFLFLIKILLQSNEIFYFIKTIIKILVGKKFLFLYKNKFLNKLFSENTVKQQLKKEKLVNFKIIKKKFLFMNLFSVEIKK